jgi:hypothetical protein
MQMQPPFTANSVWTLLHRARPLSAKPLPKRGDAAYSNVARRFCSIEQLHEHLKGAHREQEQMRTRIADAIVTLADLLPEMRGLYVGPTVVPDDNADDVEAMLIREGASAAQRSLAAYEKLVAAVNEAYQCGIPIAATIDGMASPLANETEIMARINSHLEAALPALGIGERHRFIAEAVAQITGNADLDQKKVRQRLNYRSVTRLNCD